MNFKKKNLEKFQIFEFLLINTHSFKMRNTEKNFFFIRQKKLKYKLLQLFVLCFHKHVTEIAENSFLAGNYISSVYCFKYLHSLAILKDRILKLVDDLKIKIKC